MQAINGYVENGRFYPLEDKIRVQGRKKAIITILDEPISILDSKGAVDRRLQALDKIEVMVDMSMNEHLPDFTRSKDMKPPHDLMDEGDL